MYDVEPGLNKGINFILLTKTTKLLKRPQSWWDDRDWIKELQCSSPGELRQGIRAFLEDRYGDDDGCVIVLVVFNPIMIDAILDFTDRNYSLFKVMSLDGNSFVSITDIHGADYMAHFSVGDLYAREEFEQDRKVNDEPV